MSRLVFVFGSNLAGKHGRGAALTALRDYGAEYGKGEGMQGNSYAIPTKDRWMMSLSLGQIEEAVKRFLTYAKDTPENTYMVTPIGTGLAGYAIRDIVGIFRECNIPSNVLFTREWFK